MAKNYCPDYTLRTAIVVTINDYGEFTETHSVMMTGYQWRRRLFDWEMNGKKFRQIDDETVLFIHDERKKGES